MKLPSILIFLFTILTSSIYSQNLTYSSDENTSTLVYYKKGDTIRTSLDGIGTYMITPAELEIKFIENDDYEVSDTIFIVNGEKTKNALQKGEYFSYYDSGNVRSSLKGTLNLWSMKPVEGDYIFYHDSGKIMKEGYMKRSKFKDALGLICGKWDGDYTEYYKSGKVKMKGVMTDPGSGWRSSLTGKYVSYYESGGIKKKGEYIADEGENIYTVYYETGKVHANITAKGNFIFSIPEQFEIFYENGKLQMKGKLVLGDDPNTEIEERSWMDGFSCFDENGNALTKENCPLEVLDKLIN